MVHKFEKKESESNSISMEETVLPTTPEEIEAEEQKKARSDNLARARESRQKEKEEQEET